MTIHLTLKAVKEAGRKAYLEGRLSAQGPTPECAYRDKSGRPCIIGAALTDEEARALDHADDGSIDDLIREGLVKTAATAALPALQTAHDHWASVYNTAAQRHGGHATLCKLLGLPKPVEEVGQ